MFTEEQTKFYTASIGKNKIREELHFNGFVLFVKKYLNVIFLVFLFQIQTIGENSQFCEKQN